MQRPEQGEFANDKLVCKPIHFQSVFTDCITNFKKKKGGKNLPYRTLTNSIVIRDYAPCDANTLLDRESK